MKKSKRLLSIFLAMAMALLLMFGITTTALAEDSQARSSSNVETATTSTDVLLAVDEVSGASASSIESLFGKNQNLSRGVAPKLSSIKLLYEDGKLVLQGALAYTSKIIDFVSSGDLYENEKTDNADTYGNLILGDMSDFYNVHFVQLKIDKDKSCIIIILQMNDTKQLMQFQIQIDSSIFDKLSHLQKKQLSGPALEKKLIELYSVADNLIDKDSSTNKVESISPSISTSSIQPMATSYIGWAILITDLNKLGSVILGDYANIDKSMFKGNGWRYDNQWGSIPYSFAAYSTPNGTDEYLTQYSLADIATQSYSGTGDLWYTNLQADYRDGMIVKYDSYLDTLSVLYYNWGLRLNNFGIGINGLTNNGIFISRSVNRTYESSGSIVRAAIAVFNPLDTIASVFEHLQPYENQDASNTRYFDPTYSQQYARYNGQVIRGVAANTENNFLTHVGHFINVAGTIKYNTSTGTSWQYGYTYNSNKDI